MFVRYVYKSSTWDKAEERVWGNYQLLGFLVEDLINNALSVNQQELLDKAMSMVKRHDLLNRKVGEVPVIEKLDALDYIS